jgi:hypothetical protein
MDVRTDYAGKPPVVPRGDLRSKSSPAESPGRLSRTQLTVGSGASGASARSTPRSVVVGSVTLSRDLSDLSGSYHHGVTNGVSPSHAKAIPQHIYRDDGSSVSSLQKSWRQAYMLSSPSPDTILNDLMDAHNKTKPRILPNENDSVKRARQRTPKARSSAITTSPRIPLLVLLMDTNKRSYEILRIFVDIEMDNVRDVLKSIRQNLPNKWKQDYDGLLQFRSEVPSQLINCLSVQHYDVQPFECWIAKPWSVSAKTAGHCGESLIYHLKHLGVLVDTKAAEDTIVKLSEVAEARIYEPDGTLDHYHAKQYLTFSPPFEMEMAALLKRHVAATATDDLSNTSRSRGSLAARLEAFNEDDDEEAYNEDGQEVQTVGSYSHLLSLDPFQSFAEEEEKVAAEPSFSRNRYKFDDANDDDEKVSPKFKGFVVKLLGLSNSASSSSRSNNTGDSLLVNNGNARTTWDLTPLNSAASFANSAASIANSAASMASCCSSRDDLSHYSMQPIL